ncbi:MAG: hypothetical protein IT436_15475 [Phycisphaerales bacterium]|nr:hypothetical protein [Phycisphaerales bacterium]
MRPSTRILRGAIAAGALLPAAPAALGQRSAAGSALAPLSDEPAGVTAAKQEWRAEIHAWAWLMSIDGDVGARGLQVNVSESFVDIVDESDSLFALSGRLEFGYGRFGAYADGLYADITVKDQTGPLGLADIELDIEQTIVDFGLMYRLVDQQRSGGAANNPRNLTFDLYGGGRYAGLDVNLKPAALPNRSDSEDWLDPIVGGKVVVPLAEHWHMAVNGDVGGFGVASDFTWSATAVIGYDFHIFDLPASVLAGYRAIGWDYSNGSGPDEFTWDVIEHGVIIGFSLAF